jgi:hypothetical protein
VGDKLETIAEQSNVWKERHRTKEQAEEEEQRRRQSEFQEDGVSGLRT